MVKFVDDQVSNEKLNMRDQPSYIENDKEFKNARARESERLFRHIEENATKQGLIVNSKKTAMIVVSGANSFKARAHLYNTAGGRVDSTQEMKLLGFTFNSKADVWSQINALVKKFRNKMWTLRDLRKAGFNEQKLMRVYKSSIRPIVEYSSVVYHSMLSKDQAEYLEKQQVNALKNIFGYVYTV